MILRHHKTRHAQHFKTRHAWCNTLWNSAHNVKIVCTEILTELCNGNFDLPKNKIQWLLITPTKNVFFQDFKAVMNFNYFSVRTLTNIGYKTKYFSLLIDSEFYNQHVDVFFIHCHGNSHSRNGFPFSPCFEYELNNAFCHEVTQSCFTYLKHRHQRMKSIKQ